MDRLVEIKNGMRSSIQEEWPSWEDIEWLINKVEEQQEEIVQLSAHNLDLALDYAHLKTQK